jgi:carboxyl-terminal processing protease
VVALLCCWLPTVAVATGDGDATAGEAHAATSTPLISKALDIIEELYLHPEAVVPARMLEAAMQRLEHLDPAIVVTEQDGGVLEVAVAGRRGAFDVDIESLAQLEQTIAEVIDFVDQSEGTTEPISRNDLELSALRGMLRTIDRHSRLFAGGSLDEFNTRFKGTLVGIGARIGKRGGKMKVVQPFPDAPAGRAGLKAGDYITHVDGVATAGLTVEETVERIRGPEGLPVVLTIERGEEAAPRIFVLIREKVLVPSIESEMLQGGIGLVKIEHFSQKTSREFAQHLDTLRADVPLKGLVIDLRGNTGGSMRHASRIVNYFVEQGTIIRTEGSLGEPVPRLTARIEAEPERLRYEGPIAVLVDRRTASGAEIVAGALKLLGRSLTLGAQTYGKGTVQKVYPLRKSGEKVSMKLTVARYLLPGDTFVNSVGVTPDVLIGTLWLDPDQVTLPDFFREPPELIGGELGHGGLDSRRNPGSGRAEATGGNNSAPVMRVRVTRVLDGWDPASPTGEEPATPGEHLEPSREETPSEAEAGFEAAEEPDTPGYSELPGDAGEPVFNDVPLRLAHEVLVAAGGRADRQALIDLAAPRAARWQALQSERLHKSAALRDIAWQTTAEPRWMARSPGRSAAARLQLLGAPPAVHAELLLPERLEAGEETAVVLSVRNTSKAPLRGLRAQLRSSSSVLDRIDFLVGDLAPGQAVQRKVPVSVPAGAKGRLDPWRLYLLGEQGPLGGPFTGTVETRGAPHPEFAISLHSSSHATDGGGIQIDTRIEVRNQGEGPSGELTLRFSRPEEDGIELLEQYRTIEGLEPGTAATIELGLRVRDPHRHAVVPIKLRARDRSTGVATTVELDLPATGAALDTGWLVPATISMSFPHGQPGDPPSRADGPFDIHGVVEAQAGLAWVEVRVSGDKVFSRKSPRSTGEQATLVRRLEVHARGIPKTGANRVSVRARTKGGVVVTSNYWVLGEKP